ncbi:MAG: 2-amino-4-hydroxy-6-hydroxymethyldihydropteridine diphosphokinase [Bacteroidales bacterium]|nr:2-amino-4-hydroxy-6-hydroxymethyldihydropteridine diphosphokinase [Bacteroidales bacterium]
MIFLMLGSNLGDREAYLDFACKRLHDLLGVELIKSPYVPTKAVGFDGEEFINQAVAFDCEIEPLQLLDICQQIEMEAGRGQHRAEYNSDGSRKYCSRVLDIDILSFNDLEMNTERLVLPHPQLESRAYVKEILKMIEI